MNKSTWDNALCEPVLITYNRAASLQSTLEAFFAVSHGGMRFHVLDNASTDDTPLIIQAWQARWPGLIAHRNAYNIGGNANILRAQEMSAAEYSWVLGDDDVWHLEHLEEVMDVLRTRSADVIRLGWLVSAQSAGTSMDAVRLSLQENLFFASLSMISATIVRRAIMTKYLPWAYMNCAYFYPQLVPCMMAFEAGPLVVYSVRQPLMTHTPSTAPGYFVGDLAWYVAWFKSARFLRQPSHKKHCIAEAVRYMIRPRQGFWVEMLWLLKMALNGKVQNISQWSYLGELFVAGSGWRGRILLVLIVYSLCPRIVALGARRVYDHLYHKSSRASVSDASRL